jgi:2-polyprenyl-3-methyl-5-hydroxy-6-metoxy-1,4-benzoquinol methylase
MKAGSLLVVPAFEKNRGGGHLIRSVALVRSLRAAGQEAFLYLPVGDDPSNEVPRAKKLPVQQAPGGTTAGSAGANDELLRVSGLLGEPWIAGETPGSSEPWLLRGDPEKYPNWAFIILDRFRTPPEEAAYWASLAPLIGIDEGGPARNSFEFLIDLLPALKRRGYEPPNAAFPSLIPLPKNRRPSFSKIRRFPENGSGRPGGRFRVLISFGAEDLQGLTVPAALGLSRLAGPEQLETTVIAPGLPKDQEALLKTVFIRVLDAAPDIRERLWEYDLVITHYGLTAFEAIHARVLVLLVSPGEYHEKLALNAGFISAGIGPAAAGRVGRLLFSFRGERNLGFNKDFLYFLSVRCGTISSQYGFDQVPDNSLGDLLASYTPPRFRSCPGCGGTPWTHPKGRPRTLARFPDRSYRCCSHCGMVYMIRSSPPPIEYGVDYFFDLYKRQYGKTYLEDFPNLVEAGKKRLTHVKAVLQKGLRPDGLGQGGPLLLDIGCAYGPFLAAARDEGFSPLGIDAAPDAVRHVRETLGLPAYAGFFPRVSLPESAGEADFSVVSLWYVIEHFEALPPVLGKINRLLKTKGVLAFSTPSFRGISGRKAPIHFLEKSPMDHWTIWSPGICRKLLAHYGFTLKKILVTGHHPERFFRDKTVNQGGGLWNLLLGISRLFGLGDTFECYAVKKEDYNDGI